jgi:sugar phosphate isomerase/epimerase
MTNEQLKYPRLCLHTITTRAWNIEEAIENYAQAGLGGITIWRQALEGCHAPAVGRMARQAGLQVVSLCRGGFFPAVTHSKRQAALDDNRRALEQAAQLGAPLLVLVPGAAPGQSLQASRTQIAEGIAALLPEAQAAGVRLGIEPLHPMYAADRSAINTLRQANELCAALASPWVGVVVDVYHLWWDPDLPAEIARCAQGGWLAAFHLSDWLANTRDLLNDRGLMGEGCIPLRELRHQVESGGFNGFHEVEIFSERWWARDPKEFLTEILAAYQRCC